jgi:hypothetical protein
MQAAATRRCTSITVAVMANISVKRTAVPLRGRRPLTSGVRPLLGCSLAACASAKPSPVFSPPRLAVAFAALRQAPGNQSC